MSSDSIQPDHEPADTLAWKEATEAISVVCNAAEAHPSLLEFTDLLSNLIQLHESLEESQASDAQQLAGLICDCTRELRHAIDSEGHDFQQIDALSDQAINQWGEHLLEMREGADYLDDAAWEFADAMQGSESTAEEGSELAAPSADAIQALLDQLGTALEPSGNAVQAADNSSHGSSPERGQPVTCGSTETDTPTQDRPELEPELREAFLDDASSCLAAMEAALLRIEKNPQDLESLTQILRELHTLKGASGSVGMMALAEQIHQLEDRLRDEQTAGRVPSIDDLLRSVDEIRVQISCLSPKQEPQQQQNSVVDAVASLPKLSDFSADDDSDELVRVRTSQLNRLMDMLAELVMLRNQRETELADLQSVYHELVTSVSHMRMLSNDGEWHADQTRSLQLSEVANDVMEAAQGLRDCMRPFVEGNAAVSRFIRQFRQELVALRRTPVSGLFRRLQRVVRDAARTESKQVRLEIHGGEAGIERALQQRLYEPLLHILRNSVGHGIEPADVRLQAGKPAEGVILLTAKSGTDHFTIEVRDDGRGLDYEAIRRRGVEKGLLSPHQSASQEQLSQLIFHPGFSTREAANQVGGRGVGMDVVATTLKRMHGWLTVESQPGVGTRIKLNFPLPSAIQHAMVFRCGRQLFAIPMESVLATGKAAQDIPRIDFAQLLSQSPDPTNRRSMAIVVAQETAEIEGDGLQKLALLVDEVIGPEELVVRPLPTLLKNHPYCVGATLAGTGQTVLLLDSRRVLQARPEPLDSLFLESSELPNDNKADDARQLHVLVVDDSLSARKRVVRSLSRYPLKITEATHGTQAMELMMQHRFAAVFSDLEMPHMDGLELLAEIQSGDPKLALPVVIISSRAESEFTDRARQLGVASYLIKPLADEALDSALNDIPSLRHLVSESSSNRLEQNS
ncbi:MAG: response regulator [bacterium]|nr:response regulator [bacterium]